MTPVEGRRQRRELMRSIEREHRQAARQRVAELRAALKDARTMRRIALVQARQRCHAERVAARARARQLYAEGIARLRDATRQERLAARQACDANLAAARGIKERILRARAELEAERKYQRDMKRIERANRARTLEFKRTSKAERRAESDDEVRGNIPPEFVALFERVKRGIKASPRMSRTEAFLHYAEENPEEVLEAISDTTDELVRQLAEQHRDAVRATRRPARLASPRYTAEQLAEVPF
jgi:hypothetical protein